MYIKQLLANISNAYNTRCVKSVSFSLCCSVGEVVRIEERHFREGVNDVRLVVRKADGTSEEVSLTVNLEREEPTGTAAQPTPVVGTLNISCTLVSPRTLHTLLFHMFAYLNS